MKIDWPKLILFIVIAQLTGILSSLLTFESIPNWYAFLNKPLFSPPNWVFGPVWTILYFMIGVTGYFIYKSKNKKLMQVFWIQLALNFFWSIIFFGLKMPELALLEIIVMWSSIFYLIIYSQKKVKIVSYLLIPYLLWVTFASALNFAIVLLN